MAFFHAFAFNIENVQFDIWMGVATLEAIRKAGLAADPPIPSTATKNLPLMDGRTSASKALSPLFVPC